MAGDITLKYGTEVAVTMTGIEDVDSSATWVTWWTSNSVTNTSTLASDYLLGGTFTLESANRSTTSYIYVYAYAALDDTPTWPDLFSAGTEGSVGAVSCHDIYRRDSGMRLLAAIYVGDNTASAVYTFPPSSVAALFGRDPPGLGGLRHGEYGDHDHGLLRLGGAVLHARSRRLHQAVMRLIRPDRWIVQPKYPVGLDEKQPVFLPALLAAWTPTLGQTLRYNGPEGRPVKTGTVTTTATPWGIAETVNGGTNHLVAPSCWSPTTWAGSLLVVGRVRLASTAQLVMTSGDNANNVGFFTASLRRGLSHFHGVAITAAGPTTRRTAATTSAVLTANQLFADAGTFVSQNVGAIYLNGSTPAVTQSGTAATYAPGTSAAWICWVNASYGNSDILLVAAFNRTLSASEGVQLSKNPWQLFQPRRSVVYSLGQAAAASFNAAWAINCNALHW